MHMNIATTPLVSVVIPCYNHGRYLPEAVESVARQTFAAWEMIIVDDGSTDDSAQVAQRLIARYPEQAIRLLRQPNQGLSAGRNNGIRAAGGAYILPLDADDAIEPEMLEQTVAVLDRRPQVGFVYTDVRMFGDETTLWSGGSYSLAKLRFDCPMVAITLFRRAAWEMVGGFHTNLWPQGYEDWDFWLHLAGAGWQGWHIACPLVRYRRTGGSMLAIARLHDLELRAQLVLNHPTLYEPDFRAWAREVYSPAYIERGAFRSTRHWLRAFAGYTALVGRRRPALLPKTLLRPFFCRLSARQQSYARRFARLLHISQGSYAPLSVVRGPWSVAGYQLQIADFRLRIVRIS
jgi:glycosyltransferase involved in cell wall biosynthesis